MTHSDFIAFAEKYLKLWGMYSAEAVTLLAMIAAHESGGGKYRRQIGGGPARGIFQMELETHKQVWLHSDTIKQRASKFGIVNDESKLELDDVYALFVARHYLAMDTKPIPKTLIEMSKYCKSYWNRTGAATAEKYLNDYNSWVSGKI